MVLRVKKNYLIFDGKKYRCAIGKNGFIKEKCEGDGCSPIGSFKIERIFFRKDRVQKIQSKIETIEIDQKDGWCDDQNHHQYNKLIQFPFLIVPSTSIVKIICIILYVFLTIIKIQQLVAWAVQYLFTSQVTYSPQQKGV